MKILNWLLILAACSCLCGCCKSELEKKAETGDVKAQYELAQEYKKKKDFESMVKLLEKSANKDFLKAQESMAMDCFLYGDREVSLKWAQEVASKDSEIGKSVLSYYYYWGGKDFAVDRVKALKLAEETKDIPLSKAVLACFYKTGFWGIEKDIEKAEKLARESMEEGCPEGGAVLSNIYVDTGRMQEAQDVLNKGVETGYTDAIISKILIDATSKKIGYENAYNKLEKYIKINSCLAYEARAIIADLMLGCKDYDDRISELESKRFENLKQAFYGGSCRKEVYERLEEFIEKPKENVIKLYKLGIKTHSPDVLEFLCSRYYLYNRNRFSLTDLSLSEADWNEIVKIGADNGNPFLMLVYAYINLNDKEIHEKYKKQSFAMKDPKSYLRLFLKMFGNNEMVYRLGAEIKDPGFSLLMGKALLNGKIKEKSIEKDPEKGFLYLKNGFMAIRESEVAKKAKMSLGEELPKWLEEYPEYKDRIYVFALICDYEGKNNFVKKLENMLAKEEINPLKKEAADIVSHLNDLPY